MVVLQKRYGCGIDLLLLSRVCHDGIIGHVWFGDMKASVQGIATSLTIQSFFKDYVGVCVCSEDGGGAEHHMKELVESHCPSLCSPANTAYVTSDQSPFHPNPFISTPRVAFLKLATQLFYKTFKHLNEH